MIKTFILCPFFFFIGHLALLAQPGRPQKLDTVAYGTLPDVLKKDIEKNVSLLITQDTVTGKFSYVKNEMRHEYAYKLFLKDDQLLGVYTYYHDCITCAFSSTSACISAVVLYCCKDPAHSPNETAHTEREMKIIQNRDHCSKIGICIID